MDKPVFGYIKTHGKKDSPAMTTLLYRNGTFIFSARNAENGDWHDSVFHLSDACVQKVLEIISSNARDLRKYAYVINSRNPCFENENYFIFGDLRIINWDMSRWDLEEERERCPAYYKNALRVEFTEKYVRRVFDEICRTIEREPKNMQYARHYFVK